ncbi:MAG TPA: hypothetical protein VI011_10720, partial [Asanoa sp.]
MEQGERAARAPPLAGEFGVLARVVARQRHGRSVTRLSGTGQTSRMSRTFTALVRASHPEPAVAVTAVTALLAWGVG